MGVHARDLCGVPYKQVGGSFQVAVESVLGSPQRGSEAGSNSKGRRSRPKWEVPKSGVPWTDPRPPPALSTTCLGEIVGGSTTWVSNDPAAIDDLVEQCGFEAASHLGLDAEWTPTMVRGQQPSIAMLQLATRESCLLVRVGQMPLPLPPRLSDVLSADLPLKVGRGIRMDAKLIRSQLGASVNGVQELQGHNSLKDLARTVGHLAPPASDASNWMTNWDARHLRSTSLAYAAFDSIAAYAVYTNQKASVPRGRARGEPRAPRHRASARQTEGEGDAGV